MNIILTCKEVEIPIDFNDREYFTLDCPLSYRNGNMLPVIWGGAVSDKPVLRFLADNLCKYGKRKFFALRKNTPRLLEENTQNIYILSFEWNGVVYHIFEIVKLIKKSNLVLPGQPNVLPRRAGN